MRAVFSIEVSQETPAKQTRNASDTQSGAVDAKYPSDVDIETALRSFGWEFTQLAHIGTGDIKAILSAQAPDDDDPTSEGKTDRPLPEQAITANEIVDKGTRGKTDLKASDGYVGRIVKYTELSQVLFDEMPEVAAAERKAVIFLGYIASDQTLFVVTRMVPGQVTVRLLHRQLFRLQSSTQRLVKNILQVDGAAIGLKVKEQDVRVYERKFDHVIVQGQIITRQLRAAIRQNLKDFLLAVVPGIFFLATLLPILQYPPGLGDPWEGVLERANTAALATAVVSALGLLQSYVQIRRYRLIDWSVARSEER